VLDVFAQLRHKGKPHFVLVLPDGSKSFIPVAWTDYDATVEEPAPRRPTVAADADLLRLRQRVDYLLRRIEAGPGLNQNSSTLENRYATTTTGVVERGTSSHSTHLPTSDPGAAHLSDQPSGLPHP
jgi:hypothetical protein